jgi:hypothetical protein
MSWPMYNSAMPDRGKNDRRLGDLTSEYMTNVVAFYGRPGPWSPLNESTQAFINELNDTSDRWESGQRDKDTAEHLFSLARQFTQLSIYHGGRQIMVNCLPERLQRYAETVVASGGADNSPHADFWFNLAAPKAMQ